MAGAGKGCGGLEGRGPGLRGGRRISLGVRMKWKEPEEPHSNADSEGKAG